MGQYGKYRTFLERYTKCLCFALAVATAAVVTWTAACRADGAELEQAQRQLAEQVLRFHVVAASDEKEDQQLKLQVRDRVLQYLEEKMPGGSRQDVCSWARKHTGQIEEVCRQVLEENRSDQAVNAAVITCYFPDTMYGDVLFPEGNYEALRIELGEAKGHNWWGVLYPGLCFLDSAGVVVSGEEEQKLKEVLTEEAYSRMTLFSDFKPAWFFLKE